MTDSHTGYVVIAKLAQIWMLIIRMPRTYFENILQVKYGVKKLKYLCNAVVYLVFKESSIVL